METNKKELKKISRKVRVLASRVMSAYFREQTETLIELMEYIDKTQILREYFESIYEPIPELVENMKEIESSYGGQALNLGTNTEYRLNLLYQMFKYIAENKSDTVIYGRFYSSGNKYQDMAKAFGDRLVYPFINGIENYLSDIATDMGYDDDSIFHINVNSSGVQVNIANNDSNIDAIQNNNWDFGKIYEEIKKIENSINQVSDNESRNTLTSNLDIIKEQIKLENPSKTILKGCLGTIKLVATSIAIVPDLVEGAKILANHLGLTI